MRARNRGVVIKSPAELGLMRQAGRINALTLAAVLAAIQPGVTTAELDQVAADVLREHGARPAFKGYPGPYPYPAVLTVSLNDELVHGIPGKRVLKDGDLVSVDCGAVFEGYVGDSAFTVGVGEISPEAQAILDATERGLMAGIEKMRLGNRTGDVSAAIQEQVEGSGFQVVREYTGHGVGRDLHEDPQVLNYGTAGSGMALREGMTVALEPMVLAGSPETKVKSDQWTVASKDGKLTAHFEHTVGVTSQGPLILTALDGDDLDSVSLIRYNPYFAGWPAPASL